MQVYDRFLMSSLDHRGATGPSLVWHEPGMKIEFIGADRVTVGAGTFDAWHFCYVLKRFIHNFIACFYS